ncbi:MAG: type II and III secretion system protein [Victivallaceae bacterium]|nr:type II and III secretion system protein [Victivallaceae bacterium]
MKKLLVFLIAVAAGVLPSLAEDTRTIRLIQDDAQQKMATKIYDLKNLKASDIAAYIDAACRRYVATSQVRSLNFSANNQQSLIVTTAESFLPYVDDLVQKLDRTAPKNEYGSAVSGVGYKWKVYYPKYRPATDLLVTPYVMLSCNGDVYAINDTLWIKDDIDDIDYALDWVKYFDRPVPQATLTFRYYAIRESTLRDLGIDYLAWKNGPGLNLLDVEYNTGRLEWDKVFRQALNLIPEVGSAFSWSYGGFMTAPAFDMSFIRLLQQSGEAKVVATAQMTVVNAQKEGVVSLSPVYNNLTKDEDFISRVEASAIAADYTVKVTDPIICFFTEKSEVSDMGWIPSTPEFYAKNKGSLIFGYDVESNDAVEANVIGVQIGTSFSSASTHKTIEFGKEQILAQSSREHDVEQTTGVPFLCQLPVLKYIFGTTTTMHEKVYNFVTVEANLTHPETVAAAK